MASMALIVGREEIMRRHLEPVDSVAKDAGAIGRRRVRNNRLRAAMRDRGVTFAELAAATGRNVKSVQRWVYEGRIPRPGQLAAAAEYLDIDANWLWPSKRSKVHPELINLYAHIGEVPPTVWTRSAQEARRTIDIAADVIPALPHDLDQIVQAKAAEGVRVRLCVGPGVASTLDIKGALTRVNSNRGLIGIYRFDSEMVVWPNRGGFGVEHGAPALHLRQGEKGGVFGFYLDMFARLWRDGDSIVQDGKDWYRAAI